MVVKESLSAVPANIQCQATIDLPAKCHLNGIFLAGQWRLTFRSLLKDGGLMMIICVNSIVIFTDLFGPPPVEDEDDDILGSKGKFVSKGLFDDYDRCYLPC